MFLCLAAAGLARAAQLPPSFKEVYDLLKTNLVDTDEGRLDRAAVDGLLGQFSGLAQVLTNEAGTAGTVAGPVLSSILSVW